MDLDLQRVLIDIYSQLENSNEIVIGYPEYDKAQIFYLVEHKFLNAKDASSMSAWGSVVSATYSGKKYVESIQDSLLYRICKFIERGEIIFQKEKSEVLGIDMVSGPLYNEWMDEINIFVERYLKNHPLYNSIHRTYLKRKNMHSFDDMMGHLKALAKDGEIINSSSVLETNQMKAYNSFGEMVMKDDIEKNQEKKIQMRNKVFIVHGHDQNAVLEMARTIEKWGFEAVILHEQPDLGLTIIEKIEKHTDVDYAVVLYTECDYGRSKEETVSEEKFRARQNVVFEHGYLIGKLGRNNVCAVVKGNVETPGDINGVVYTPMDSNGAWKMALAKNMKEAGIAIDMNKCFG